MGSAGVDYLASVASFPEPDAKLRTDALEIQGGGNCGNALTAVARLGCAPRILTKLSDDAVGRAVVAEFEADGVDTAAIVVEPGKSSPFTYIIVDREGATRTCIHTPGPEFAPEEITPAEVDALLDGASLCYFGGRLTEVALEVAAAARAEEHPGPGRGRAPAPKPGGVARARRLRVHERELPGGARRGRGEARGQTVRAASRGGRAGARDRAPPSARRGRS